MRKKWILIAIVLLLLIAVLQLDKEALLDSINQIPRWLMLMLFGLQIITQLLVNLQWYKIAKISNTPLSFWQMFYVNAQGAVVDSITPGVKIGGEVTRAVQISRIANCSGKSSATMLAVQKIFSISALLFILLFSIGYLLGDMSRFYSRYTQFLIYSILMLTFVLFIGILFFPNKIEAHLLKTKKSHYLWINKMKHFLLAVLESVAKVRKSPKELIILTLLSLFIWLLYPIKMYILVLQFYAEANIIHVSAITFAAYLVAMLPIFPGGLGGFEGTMSGLLISMGLGAHAAAVITIFFRFVTFWFVMLFSFVFIAIRKIYKDSILRYNCE